MTTTSPITGRPTATDRYATRTLRSDVQALPTVLRSDWIKLSSLRGTRVVVALAALVGAGAAWAAATLVTDEVLFASKVFTYPTVLTATLAVITAILVFTSESQHGTLATALTAQPARWVLATSKAITALAIGAVLGAIGLATGFVGALAGGLAVGDTSSILGTTLWSLLFTSLAALLSLGIGMIVRNSAASVSGVLVWWFVGENLVNAFAPARFARFQPFDAGYHLLGIGSDFDSKAQIAAQLTRPQYALVFGAYTAVAFLVGTVLLHRRDAA
jgi:hypothetical protein